MRTSARSMPIRMKVYEQGKETLVAAADEDLLGKTFREGKFRIEVGAFYEGERVTERTLLDRLRTATIGNFVGRETVDVVTRAGYVGEGGMLWSAGVPQAQYVMME